MKNKLIILSIAQSILAILFLVYALVQRSEAFSCRQFAEEQRALAEKAMMEAVSARQAADDCLSRTNK